MGQPAHRESPWLGEKAPRLNGRTRDKRSYSGSGCGGSGCGGLGRCVILIMKQLFLSLINFKLDKPKVTVMEWSRQR